MPPTNTPNLFIIGAAKSGTTSLYTLLTQHPEVFMSKSKATRFFIKEKDYARGVDWYLATYFAGAEGYPIRGEATPSYLVNGEKIAPRIKETIADPNLKFMAIFRNPADRAYSHYWYNRNTKTKWGAGKKSFEWELEMEQRSNGSLEGKETRYSRAGALFKNGQYSLHLKEYFRHFKRDQFLFLLFEDLFNEQFQTTTARIAEFLNIEPIPFKYVKENQSRIVGARPSAQFKQRQRGLMNLLKSLLPASFQSILRNQYSKMISQPVKYPPMNTNTYKSLMEKYRPEIFELEEMIGRDLSHWRNPR